MTITCPKCGEILTDNSPVQAIPSGGYRHLCREGRMFSDHQLTMAGDELTRRLNELEKAIKEQIPLTFDELAEASDELSQ